VQCTASVAEESSREGRRSAESREPASNLEQGLDLRIKLDRLKLGAEALDRIALLVEQELLKIPHDVGRIARRPHDLEARLLHAHRLVRLDGKARVRAHRQRKAKELEDVVRAGTVHLELLRQRELGDVAVARPARPEAAVDLLLVEILLRAELVARARDDRETLAESVEKRVQLSVVSRGRASV